MRLTAGGKRICSGIAIGPHWVLTAAHCTMDAERVVHTGLGATGISARFCHSRYERAEDHDPEHRNAKNDLALILVDGTLPAPPGGQWPVPGAVGKPSDEPLVLLAWGKQGVLYKSLAMAQQDPVVCQTKWTSTGQKIEEDEEFCAGAGASSGCEGDSGGPLFTSTGQSSDPEPGSLVGILSRADTTCNSGEEDIYTVIDEAWIKKVFDPSSGVHEQNRARCLAGGTN